MPPNELTASLLPGGLATAKAPPAPEYAHSLAEESPAYRALKEADLLVTRFRKLAVTDLDLLQPNSDKSANLWRFLRWAVTGVGCCLYPAFNLEITVPAGHVVKVRDGEAGYHLAAPGMHNIQSMFWQKEGSPVPLRGHINHGDISIVVVEQGHIGYAVDNGSPVLLPPGLHQWRSNTLDFVKFIDLENHVIEIGPYTLLTVDEGYSAVTQDNGRQVILPGGHTWLLQHRQHKFEKFMSLKVQTDELEKISATSADNIMMAVTSTVNWRIVDVEVAAKFAAETMAQSGRTEDVTADITKLRKDVLKQAVASLASFIGSVNYSDSFHLAAAAQASSQSAVGVPAAAAAAAATAAGGTGGAAAAHAVDNPMFDLARMNSAVETANKVTNAYGVLIMSINVISATPLDTNLTRALASGAVASAEALQAETAARGNAKAAIIEAEGAAEARRIEAEGGAQAAEITARADAESERLRAEGAKAAGDLIAASDVALTLAKMDKQVQALGDKSKLVLAAEPKMLEGVLLRPDKLGMM